MTLKISTPALEVTHLNERPAFASMTRGLRCRCPHCGEGKLFSSFAKSVENCSACGEELHHHRADDFPAYIVIFIVGHIVVAGYLASELWVTWNSWQHMALWMPVTLVMSIALLQPLKGAVIGLQWAWRMHGFSGHDNGTSDS
ncbi:MAG: DUF983 domain-containing protein [Notoacmeibacter sp.]